MREKKQIFDEWSDKYEQWFKSKRLVNYTRAVRRLRAWPSVNWGKSFS